MVESAKFIRFASPNERRCVTREALGFYNAVVIAALYEFDDAVDVGSVESFVGSLCHCIERQPYLSVIIGDKETEAPFYESVSVINIKDHVSILKPTSDGHSDISALERALPEAVDSPWPESVPPWRLIVLPLSGSNRCFIAFAYSHAIGDGMSGLSFHRTFIQSFSQHANAQESSLFNVPAEQTLPPPFDTPARLPISWTFLIGPFIAVYLPKFLRHYLGLRTLETGVNPGTWVGSPGFHDPSTAFHTHVKLFEVEASLVRNAVKVSRLHDTKMSATLHALIIRSLSKALNDPNITNFVSETAINMRHSMNAPDDAWGVIVSGDYDLLSRVDANQPILSDAWEAASLMTKKLAECAARLDDQPIGLLRYLPSVRNWLNGKLGRPRDCSYELSNLASFDPKTEGSRCKILKVVFAQPAHIAGAPMVFNVVSLKGGSLTCAITWQRGALGIPEEEEDVFLETVCTSIQADFRSLQ